MTKQTLKLFLAFCISFTLTACSNTKYVTTTLYPAHIWTASKERYKAAQIVCLFPCGLNRVAGGCGPIPKNNSATILVGYKNVEDPGTQPCACWSSSNCSYRGYVQFNFGLLPSKRVISAELEWLPKTQRVSGKVASSYPSCLNKIYIANGPWNHYSIPGQELAGTSYDGSVEVGSTVRNWVNGNAPNYGWFFVGPNESLKGKNNDECFTTASQLSLKVTTAVQK